MAKECFEPLIFAIGKVLGATGGSEATVMAGMEWAASLVADPLKTPVLINMSLGGPGLNAVLEQACNQAAAAGVLLVAAALLAGSY